MKREEYISNNEMSEFIVLAGSMDGVNSLIQKTQDKEWLKYLKTAMTNLNKVLLGRFGCITEEKRRNTIRRRLKDCEVTWTSKDGLYNVAAPNVEKMTAPLNDFYHICEVVATEHCIGCDIEKYKTCQIRKWFESCGCPAMVGNPGDKCQYWVDPKAVEKLEEVKEEENGVSDKV